MAIAENTARTLKPTAAPSRISPARPTTSPAEMDSTGKTSMLGAIRMAKTLRRMGT